MCAEVYEWNVFFLNIYSYVYILLVSLRYEPSVWGLKHVAMNEWNLTKCFRCGFRLQNEQDRFGLHLHVGNAERLLLLTMK